MTLTDGLILGLLALAAYAYWQKHKREVAEALNANIDEKKELNALDAQKQTDNGVAQRDAIQKTTDEQAKENLNAQDLANFFNDPK